jgi:hypothetical protein
LKQGDALSPLLFNSALQFTIRRVQVNQDCLGWLEIKWYTVVKHTVLSVLLYGCETWSLTLRKERWLRVSENRVLRKLFGPKRGEVIEE